jgi:nitrogen PTS system EIIA component
MPVFTDAFSKELCLFHPAGIDNKKNCFELICSAVSQKNPGLKKKVLFDALYERESIGNTLIVPEIAIPHTRVENLITPIGVMTKLEKPIPFSADNELTATLLFSLFVAENAQQEHLNILSQLAIKLRNPTWTEQLLHADCKDSLWSAFCG